jgi:thiol-disulfide isomerase/thioredoxin
MKKLFTLFAIGLIATLTSNLSAQSQRFVLSEEFTQASCGPCASQNPAFNALLQANEDKIIAIKYQTSWPGVDPMNADNPTEVQNRVDLYGVNGVPMATVDGSLIANDCSAYEGAPACLNQADIDAAYSIPSSFDITVTAGLENGILDVTTNLTCTQDVSGNYKLFVVLIEKVIEWGTPPGSNGEVVFYNVMKKFLPDVSGIDIPGSWNNGDNNAYEESLSIGELNVYSMGELAVIAFIQDSDTKEILQAGAAMNVDIVVDYNNSCAAAGVLDLPGTICTGEQSIIPGVKLINTGNVDLTSATITYNVNDGPEQTMEWTGLLLTLASEGVVLDPYTFEATDNNIVSVTVSMPNGVADEDPNIDNNTADAAILAAPSSGPVVEIEILTDQYADETYWEIRNSAGEIVAHGGNPNVGIDNIGTGTFPPPFSDESYGNNEQINVSIELPADDCYTFHITDYYGDGILSPGYFQVNDYEGNMIIAPGFTIEKIRDFSGEEAVSVEELNVANFRIYPNPTTSVAHIAMNLLESNTVRLEVVYLLGKVVYEENMGQVAAGNQLFDVDASSIGNGMYMFNIYVGEQKVTKRVSISK